MSQPLPFHNRPVRVTLNADYVEGEGWRLHADRRLPWELWSDSSPVIVGRLADSELADAMCIIVAHWLA